jgi:hypothetical protein
MGSEMRLRFRGWRYMWELHVCATGNKARTRWISILSTCYWGVVIFLLAFIIN